MDYDDAYANSAHIPGSEAFPDLWARSAQAFRDSLGSRACLGLAYGRGDRQAHDLFLPDASPKGTVIFVHGGYWRASHRSDWSHLAAGSVARGWAVAMPSYDLCPAVRISDITVQIAGCVQAVAADSSGPIALAGHSAGGHLVSRMLDPCILPAAVVNRLIHVLAISPLSDLRPLMQTAMNADFGMDLSMAEAESPRFMTDRHDVPVTVWVGGAERPVFLDQAQWLAEAWEADHVIAPGRHHFNVIEDLTDEHSDMVRRLTPA